MLLPNCDRDGCSYLDHLDESNTEVEVGQVTADQAQAEEDTNRDDSTEVDATGHLDRLATVKEGSVAGHQLCRNGCEGQMVGGEDNRVTWDIVRSCPRSQLRLQ